MYNSTKEDELSVVLFMYGDIISLMKYFIYLLTAAFINIGIGEDLSRQKPIEKVLHFKGSIGINHYYEPNKLTFKAGKLYKLILINNSDSKHYFSSNAFSKAIFTRKIQINFNNKKLAEVKGIIQEVEVWPKHQIEWWFVPIKTGLFTDLFCKVKDKKSGLKHSEMGMRATIIIQ